MQEAKGNDNVCTHETRDYKKRKNRAFRIEVYEFLA